MNDLARDAYAVLLPALDLEPHQDGSGHIVPTWLSQLLRSGTSSVLIGETRAEYIARKMAPERVEFETAEQLKAFTDAARRETDQPLLVAVDQEPWGIQRLHNLVRHPSTRRDGRKPGPIESAAQVATTAKEFGINVFLSPVLDRLTGSNPWLEGRTLDLRQQLIGELAADFVENIQINGVAAVAKHFPGFPEVTADPAEELAVTPRGTWTHAAIIPFKACVDAGVYCVMTGPAPVEDIDPDQPASTSEKVVRLLREEARFDGLIISDDLDAPATLQGRSLNQTAIDAIDAGVNMLLVGGGNHLEQLVESLCSRAAGDPEFAAKLHSSASRVRELANQVNPVTG